MSTVSTLSGLNSATLSNTTNSNSTSNSSLGALSSSDFMQLMIQQLSHQDPLNPTDSNQMLGQISQISTLQSNTQMTSALTQMQAGMQSLTLQQSIGAGGNLIGKQVAGLNSNGTPITGNVTSVTVVNNAVNLTLDTGASLPMANVAAIGIPSSALSASAANTTVSNTSLGTLVSALSGIL